MSRTRRLHAWSIALACALIFLFSSSPTQVLRALSGVVTSGPAIPDPVPPPVTVAHEAGDEALHEQPDDALTASEAVPAAFEKLSDVGDTV